MPTNDGVGKQATLIAFGQLLKRLRVAGDLTQEELAEQANVSARLISDLERGTVHRPRRDTVQLLADGLRLRGHEREAFIALARDRSLTTGRDPSAQPARRFSLPHPPTPIVGRLKETAAAVAILIDTDVQLLTLSGPGGVGKTRLAIEVAFKAGAAFPDGAVFVDLAPVRDPELVPSAIAQALDLVADREESPHEVVIAALRARRLLLVLDNFEHLAAAANFIASLLATCSGLTVLATSRVPLRIRVEHEYPVGPLPLPDQKAMSSLDELARTPAVDLFVRRAEAANRTFALTSENAAEIAEIAIRLDGLPLAIELAATRIKVLAPGALLARLERRLPMLTGGAQDLPERQQTLRATLDWSHALLTSDEQMLFRRLSVFTGGCTLESAEFVADVWSATETIIRDLPDALPPDGSAPLTCPSSPSMLDLMAGLIDKSLLRSHDDGDEQQRFAMLETIREYGLERLIASGEESAIRVRHLTWYVDLVERAAPELNGADQLVWLRRLECELANIRASLGWVLERQHAEPALRLSSGLSLFWTRRGRFVEGRRWLEQALALPQPGVPPTIKANALLSAATCVPASELR